MPEVLDLTFFAFAIPAVIFAGGISKGGALARARPLRRRLCWR